MKIIQTIIGIDPGMQVGISVLKQTLSGLKLESHKMRDDFMKIVELLKPHGGLPGNNECRCSIEQINMRPNNNPFANSAMQPLFDNVRDLKNALKINNIVFQEVAPVTWQKYHNLVLPKESEKGVDYPRLRELKKESKQIPLHQAIENRTPNNVVITEKIKYILNKSGAQEARKALNDGYAYFTKYELNTSLKEAEKEIGKILAHEKHIRKNRYKKKAFWYVSSASSWGEKKIKAISEKSSSITIGKGKKKRPITIEEIEDYAKGGYNVSELFLSVLSKIIKVKVTLKECDAILILLYQKYNPCQKTN